MGLPVLGSILCQYSFLHLKLQNGKKSSSQCILIDSLLSKLCGPLDSLPLEDLEAVVRLDRARGEDAPLLRQLLGHGLDVVTLKPAAASDYAHPELVGGAREPGRLPARDLPGLHRYKLVTVIKTFVIFCYRMGTLAE